MRRGGRREAGFTLVEILVATAIAGILSAMLLQMIQTWSKAMARQAAKAARMMNEQDMRRLYTEVIERGRVGGVYPSAGPWPAQVPGKQGLEWTRPAPGFEELHWAPGKTPTLLQYAVDGWATGFLVTGMGDLDKDGAMELYRISGDVGMFEGPLPWPPTTVTPINPTGPLTGP